MKRGQRIIDGRGDSDPVLVEFILELIPHYRSGLVRKLEQLKSMSFSWSIGDRAPIAPGVPASHIVVSSSFKLRNRLIWGRLRWQSGAVRRALRSPADVIVATGDPAILSTWIVAIVSRTRGKHVAYWTHGWTHPDQGWKRLIRLCFYNLSSGLFVYHEAAVSIGMEMGYRGRIHVIGNSTDVSIRDSALDNSRNRADRQVWCVSSRLIEDRRIELVMEGIAYLRSLGHSVRLVIIGDGPMMEKLQKYARDLDIEADFLGAVYEEEATAELLRTSDVLVSPGHVGLGAIHAMSNGCPVATHSNSYAQMPEAAAVIDGVTGVLFEQGNPTDLASKVWNFVVEYDRGMVNAACHDEVTKNWTAERQASLIEEGVLSLLGR